MLIFDILKHGSSTLNFNSSDNIARIIKCDISKSKLALSTCNGVYFSSTALIVFTLYEIKQVKIFLGHPVPLYLPLPKYSSLFLNCRIILYIHLTIFLSVLIMILSYRILLATCRPAALWTWLLCNLVNSPK